MGWTALAAAAVAVAYETGKTGKGATVAAPAPAPATQATSAPDTSTVRAQQAGTGQAGGQAGVAQTFLTGPGGVDPSLLQLGKNTLLGGSTTTGG